ncbi:MAG: hypothetical protein WC879_09870 [Melioribacteraceae bacterium]
MCPTSQSSEINIDEINHSLRKVIKEHPECLPIIARIKKYHNDVDEHSLKFLFNWEPYITFKWIPKYENNILAFVYAGAAFLVFVLGLRGLGTNIPAFFQGENGRVALGWIWSSLGFECFMILLLAFTMFFKTEDHGSLFDHFFLPEVIKPIDSSISVKEAIVVIERLSKDYDELKKLLDALNKKLNLQAPTN